MFPSENIDFRIGKRENAYKKVRRKSFVRSEQQEAMDGDSFYRVRHN